MNQAELAREWGVSRARITQLVKLPRTHADVIAWAREHASEIRIGDHQLGGLCQAQNRELSLALAPVLLDLDAVEEQLDREAQNRRPVEHWNPEKRYQSMRELGEAIAAVSVGGKRATGPAALLPAVGDDEGLRRWLVVSLVWSGASHRGDGALGDRPLRVARLVLCGRPELPTTGPWNPCDRCTTL